jgi:NSS family neurotransmitter:Na+ symporter
MSNTETSPELRCDKESENKKGGREWKGVRSRQVWQFFFATLGSAVGLGNIWKFPYLTGQYGGGAFLLVYFLCIIFVGLPVMLSEFFIGRSTRKGAVGAFEKIAPYTSWKNIGKMGVAASYLIMFFYSCVAGWVYYYLFKAIRGDFVSITMESASVQFGSVVTSAVIPLFWQFVVMAVVSGILILGIRNGIERVTKTLMPLLFVLIIICDIQALSLRVLWME